MFLRLNDAAEVEQRGENEGGFEKKANAVGHIFVQPEGIDCAEGITGENRCRSTRKGGNGEIEADGGGFIFRGNEFEQEIKIADEEASGGEAAPKPHGVEEPSVIWGEDYPEVIL